MIVVFIVLGFCYEVKEMHGAKWLKVFHHDCTGGYYFSNLEEAAFSTNPRKFSIIKLINDDYKVDGYFEFLLEYPEIPGMNRWKQLKSPYDNPEVYGKTADGYQGISISWDKYYWGGLIRSSLTGITLLEGSAGAQSYAWYMLGCISNGYYPYIPGPNGIYVNIANLWIRIDGTKTDTSITVARKGFNLMLQLLTYFMVL